MRGIRSVYANNRNENWKLGISLFISQNSFIKTALFENVGVLKFAQQMYF